MEYLSQSVKHSLNTLNLVLLLLKVFKGPYYFKPTSDTLARKLVTMFGQSPSYFLAFHVAVGYPLHLLNLLENCSTRQISRALNGRLLSAFQVILYLIYTAGDTQSIK